MMKIPYHHYVYDLLVFTKPLFSRKLEISAALSWAAVKRVWSFMWKNNTKNTKCMFVQYEIRATSRRHIFSN